MAHASDDRAAVEAPLLRESAEFQEEVESPEPSHGSLFVWSLTFTAGLSGLLFGYE